jgi:hypothetical protein
MKGQSINIEVEYDFEVFEVEAVVYAGEMQTYDYCGSAPDVDIWKVYDEQGCEIQRELDYITLEYIEEQILEYYNNQ